MVVRRFVAALVCSGAIIGGAGVARSALVDDDRPAAVESTDDGSGSDDPSPDGGPSATAPTSTDAPPPLARDAVTSYVQAIIEGRFEDAYALLCEPARVTVPEADFVNELSNGRNRLPIRSVVIEGVFDPVPGEALVDAMVSYGADSRFTATVEQAAPGGPWLICNINGGYAEVLVWPLALDPDGERH